MAQARAARQQADYNARLQEKQAALVREDGRENRDRMRENNRRRLARMRAHYAGMGLDINSGTPLSMYGDAASKLELAVADKATATERRAQQLEAGAAMTSWSGDNQSRAATLGSLGSGIRGLGSLASSGFDFYDRIWSGKKTTGENYEPAF